MAEAVRPDIGKYHIVELVGEGAMGVVYKATDSVLDRTVAIKVMNDAIARQDDLRKRFLHEAQAAASLQHPNVVTIYDLGEVDGHLFIAMEFVEGIDLEKLLELGQPLSLQAKLDIAIDVLTGLSFAHRRGIIHRDIKPANIRVTEDGRAKIMDFGVAHLSSSSMTTTGSILGTPSYMAPEQITEGQTTQCTDIFAVGCVTYQLLTQMKPFEGTTLQNLFFKIITEKPRRVSEMMPGLPPALDKVVERAMAKEPSERYPNAIEMANELSAIRAKLSGPSYPESVSLSQSVSSAIEQARRKQSRTRSLVFAGIGAAAAVVILFTWAQLTKPSPASLPAAQVETAPPTSTQQSTALPTTTTLPPAPAPAAEKPTAKTPTTRTVTPPPPRAAAQKTAKVAPSNTNSRPTQAAVVTTPTTTIQTPAQNTVTPQQAAAQPPPVVVQRPTQTQEPTPAPPPPPKAATLSDIAPVVEAFARAVETGDIGAVRRVYPGITSFQQRGFETFFQRAKNINATFRIDSFDGSTTSADARLIGRYDFINADGKADTQPAVFAVTFQREGNAWRLVSMR